MFLFIGETVHQVFEISQKVIQKKHCLSVNKQTISLIGLSNLSLSLSTSFLCFLENVYQVNVKVNLEKFLNLIAVHNFLFLKRKNAFLTLITRFLFYSQRLNKSLKR